MKVIKFIVIAFLVLPALWLLAFGPRSETPIPPGRIVIDYWEKWTTEEGAAMKVIVDDFNDTVGAQNNIFVRYVSTSNVNQKTLVATAAGVPPDVAGLWETNMVQFASLDALTPLEDFAARADPPITQATYKPVFWNACHYHGHLYALISTPMAVALHYNKDAFRDAGLDPEHPPQTLQELDKDAELLDRRGAHGRLLRTGFLPTVPGWYVNFSYLWFGGSIWDEAHHKFTLTDPKVVESFKWIQAYSKRLGKDATNEFQAGQGNFDSPQNPFLVGTLAMTQQGPWMANYIRNLNPAMSGLNSPTDEDMNVPMDVRRKRMHWAVAPFPTAVPGLNDVTLCVSDTLCIPRGARHPNEAFKFMSYVNRQKVMEKLCKSHSKNSPLMAVSEDFLQHHKNAYIDVFENLSKSPNAHSTPQIPIFPEVDAEIGIMVQKLALLDAEPEPALRELQDRLQKKYDQFMEKQLARDNPSAGQ